MSFLDYAPAPESRAILSLRDSYGLFIDGEFVDGRGTPFQTSSPATEERIATIGDMPNDVLMFARSGLSIAMGNAHREVQRAALHVTTANDDDGFANAVRRFILGRS